MPYASHFLIFANHLEAIIANSGYAVLIILTLLEGIPVIGMAVPGHTAIIIAGFLARTGTLELLPVILIGIGGAIIGDFIGFWLGRRYGISFIDKIRPYFFVTDVHIEKARDLLTRHTGKAMIIGRFTPATRALMPFLVGASKTSSARFWTFNVIGGVCWAVSSIMVGYLFGTGYHVVSGFIGKFTMSAIIFAIVIIWGYRFVNARFHIFRKYELFTLTLNILALATLALMIQDASSSHPFMIKLDVAVSDFMAAHNQGTALYSFLARLSSVISTVGGTAVMGILGLLLSGWMLWKRKWRSAAISILSVGGTAVMIGLMKELFLRVRPENALQVIINDPSFPSGHASMAAAFFLVVAYFCALRIHSLHKRELAIAGCVLLILLIGVSRLVLNVHWFSDVLAGWALGIFIATASILLVRYLGAIILPRAQGMGK
jgi:undecaprenyl-diphosphatase